MHIVEDAGFLGWINEVDLWNSSSGRCDFMCYHSYGLRVTGVFFYFFYFSFFLNHGLSRGVYTRRNRMRSGSETSDSEQFYSSIVEAPVPAACGSQARLCP